mgnify:CR=1 FL=1
MELLILAAGTGSRLSPQTDHLPKCLLAIENDVTILDHQLGLAKNLGIKTVTIVIGFQHELIEKALEKAKPFFEKIITVYNPFFETTNNLVSLWLGFDGINDTVLMMNGDSVLNLNILRSCVSVSNDIIIPISKKDSYDTDDTKLALDSSGHILEISKKIPPEKISAEWMGVCLFPRDKIKDVKAIIESKIRQPELLKAYPHYLSVFNELIAQNHVLKTKVFDSYSWAEIDYQFDLDDVRAHVKRYR